MEPEIKYSFYRDVFISSFVALGMGILAFCYYLDDTMIFLSLVGPATSRLSSLNK